LSDPLKIVAAVILLILGTRAAAWGETPASGSKVFP